MNGFNSRFPSPQTADPQGLVAIGGDLELETLIDAYLHGIFPWPINDEIPLAWFSPDPRGVIFPKNVHIPNSLLKIIKKNSYQITFNKAFNQVIEHCRLLRENQTWITSDIIKAYEHLFKNHFAYSVEVWKDHQLVGGLYGVCIGNYFTGESMFHLESNTSKLALVHLLKRLQQKGVPMLDTQMTTSVVGQLGGESIPRSQFLEILFKSRYDLPRKYFLGQ